MEEERYIAVASRVYVTDGRIRHSEGMPTVIAHRCMIMRESEIGTARILHVNMQSLVNHIAELTASLRLIKKNWLDPYEQRRFHLRFTHWLAGGTEGTGEIAVVWLFMLLQTTKLA